MFLGDDDLARHLDAIVTMLGDELPFTIDGYPTHFISLTSMAGF